jgi:hypothetical protein
MGIAQAAVLADFNGDTWLDAASANLNSTVSIRLGNGSGGFGTKTDFATGSGSSWIEKGDLNGDGRVDLAVTNASVDNVSILFGNGDGTFAPKTDLPMGDGPNCVAIGNLDGNNVPYLFVTNQYANTVSFVKSNLDGTFTPRVNLAVGSNPSFVTVADLDGNGFPDLAITNYSSNSVTIYRRKATGGLGPRIDYSLAGSPTSVAAGDLNGDGHPDLAVSLGNGKVSILLNRGDQTPLAVEPPEARMAERLRLHPNPSRGALAISFASESPGPLTVEVLDVMGRRVLSRDLGPMRSGLHRIQIEGIRPLPAGVYLVRATHGSRTFWARAVVLR